MYKNLIISWGVALALLISIVGGLYLVNYVDTNIADAKRQAITRAQRVEAGWNSSELKLSSRITVLGDSFNDHAHTSYLQQTQTGSSIDNLTQDLERLSALHDSTATELSRALRGQEEIRNQVQLLQSESTAVLEFLEEINNALILLRTRLDSIEVQSIEPEGSEETETAQSSYSQSCPGPLNRDKQLPYLQKAMNRSASSGTHSVTVKFDIQEDGTSVVRNTNSDTAPNSLVRAVDRYVSRLVFAEQATPLVGCERIVKLDMGHRGRMPW